MPDFLTPLSPDELVARQRAKGTRVDVEPYISYVQTIPHGGAGEIKLEPGENKATIKRRVDRAALELGKTVRYVRSPEDELLFEVSDGQPEES